MALEDNTYEICGQGHLDEQWAWWLEGMAITHGFSRDGTPVTRLSGPVLDQAALHGVLIKLRDIGIPILSINRLESSEGEQE